MEVKEVIQNHKSLMGQKVIVQGFVVSDGKVVYIAPDEETRANLGESILVAESSFLAKLYASAPPWGGGKYVYRDPIEIIAVVCYSENQPFPIALESIESALVKDNEGLVYPITMDNAEEAAGE
jgi:hypothetical protein